MVTDKLYPMMPSTHPYQPLFWFHSRLIPAVTAQIFSLSGSTPAKTFTFSPSSITAELKSLSIRLHVAKHFKTCCLPCLIQQHGKPVYIQQHLTWWSSVDQKGYDSILAIRSKQLYEDKGKSCSGLHNWSNNA